MEKLQNYEVFLPSYSIGTDVYNQIESICRPYGQNVLIIGGQQAMTAAKAKLEPALRNAHFNVIDYMWYGGGCCTYDDVEMLKNDERTAQADMIFAVGGGKVLDTCKCAFLDTDMPLFAFPTIASNCAATTNVAIMYRNDGSFYRPHFFLKPAIHTFIDTEILAKAPVKYLWAGIGDTYAKYYEADISSRDVTLCHYTQMGVTISKMCAEPLFTYGVKAYQDNIAKQATEDFENAVLAVVVSTGLASIFLTRDHTPDYNSGLGHAFFYALTTLPQIEERHLHGEVVAFGILMLLLVDHNEEEFNRIYEFNKQIKLPTCMADIEVTPEEMERILLMVPDMSDIKRYPYSVTVPMLKEALTLLENKNKL